MRSQQSLQPGGVIIVLAVVLHCICPLQAQEPKDPLFRGRLPAYFGDIVTEAQRLQIYALQERYDKQISSLEDQLEALKKKRDVEIVAVLSEDQRAKLKKKQDEASAARKKTAEKRPADAKKLK